MILVKEKWKWSNRMYQLLHFGILVELIFKLISEWGKGKRLKEIYKLLHFSLGGACFGLPPKVWKKENLNRNQTKQHENEKWFINI